MCLCDYGQCGDDFFRNFSMLQGGMRRVSVQNELQMNNPSVLTSNDWKVIDKISLHLCAQCREAVWWVWFQPFAGNGALNVA